MGARYTAKQAADYARTCEARGILEACGVALRADFHALSSSQVEALVAAAKRARYRRPAHANGSTGRYYHALLQRRARGTVEALDAKRSEHEGA